MEGFPIEGACLIFENDNKDANVALERTIGAVPRQDVEIPVVIEIGQIHPEAICQGMIQRKKLFRSETSGALLEEDAHVTLGGLISVPVCFDDVDPSVSVQVSHGQIEPGPIPSPLISQKRRRLCKWPRYPARERGAVCNSSIGVIGNGPDDHLASRNGIL